MKKICVWDIDWDIDDEYDDMDLPTEVIIDDLPQEEMEDLSGWMNGDLADELSDRYGFLVNSFQAEIIEQ